jgi:hypothetical protein
MKGVEVCGSIFFLCIANVVIWLSQNVGSFQIHSRVLHHDTRTCMQILLNQMLSGFQLSLGPMLANRLLMNLRTDTQPGSLEDDTRLADTLNTLAFAPNPRSADETFQSDVLMFGEMSTADSVLPAGLEQVRYRPLERDRSELYELGDMKVKESHV